MHLVLAKIDTVQIKVNSKKDVSLKIRGASFFLSIFASIFFT